jgi:hypothetical protein
MEMKIFMGASGIRDGELAAPKGKKGKVNLINLNVLLFLPSWIRIWIRILNADPAPDLATQI